jgi:hypothetical protein
MEVAVRDRRTAIADVTARTPQSAASSTVPAPPGGAFEMRPLDHDVTKHGYATHAVPFAAMAGTIPPEGLPEAGDLALAEVLELGRHATLETRQGVTTSLFPGDRLLVAFGNRYATDQYEGYVPRHPVGECDLLSIGGVCGEVVSMHDAMTPPTRLRLLGAVCDRAAQPLNLRSFALPVPSAEPLERPEVVLVVGSSMNSGKTTTVGTIARSLCRAGNHVAALKVTGTAAGKDGRFFASSGAQPVLDFTDAGHPSTYLLELDELLLVYRKLLGHARAAGPDYVVIEIADGIFQRETRMLLESGVLHETVDHVFFAANDSLSAESGVRALRRAGLPVRATTGVVTRSPLAAREAEATTDLPCISVERMIEGEIPRLLRPLLSSPGSSVSSPVAGLVEVGAPAQAA